MGGFCCGLCFCGSHAADFGSKSLLVLLASRPLASARQENGRMNQALVPCVIATLPQCIRPRASNSACDDGLKVHSLSRVNVHSIALDVAGVRSTLLQHGVAEDRYDFAESGAKVLGFANVRTDFVYDALRVLDAGQAMQRDFWARMTAGVSNVGHLYFFHCDETLWLREPLDLHRRAGSTSFFSSLPEIFAEELYDVAEEQCVGGLPEWLMGKAPSMVVRLASPFACLLLTGATASFSVCDLYARSRDLPDGVINWSIGLRAGGPGLARLLSSFPRARWTDHTDAEDQPGQSMLSTTKVQALADATRGALCAALSQRDDLPARLQELHHRVATWESSADQLSAFLRAKHLVKGQGFHVVPLIHAFISAQCLKKDSDLHKACVSNLRMLLPEELSAEIEAWVDNPDGAATPDKSVLSRLRGRMDVAFMLVFRERLWEMVHNGGIAVFAAIDSSPQAGRDYEMLVLHIIRKTALAEMHANIMALEARVSWELEARLEHWEQEVELMRRVRDRILVHIAPPVFLGAGRSALPMKLRVVLHAMMLLSKDVTSL